MSDWTSEQRAALVRAFQLAVVELETKASALERAANSAEIARLSAETDHLMDVTSDLAHTYLAGLPRYAFARCPYSGQPCRLSFDALGLDGLFWYRDEPTRPAEEPEAGPHFIGLSGAVQLAAEVEKTPYVVTPGPGVPFIIPRLFKDQDVQAVIMSGPIGAHAGHAITYFAADPAQAPARPRIWGTGVTSFSLHHDPDRDPSETVRHFDYDLRPWIASGRLSWVAPGDPDLVLRRTIDDCPYLDLEGERALQYMQNGEVWT